MRLGTKSDYAQEPEILELVQTRTSDGISELAVEVKADRIRVSGRASSYYLKQLATQAVLEVCSGRSVCNDICVETAS